MQGIKNDCPFSNRKTYLKILLQVANASVETVFSMFQRGCASDNNRLTAPSKLPVYTYFIDVIWY